MCGGAEKGKIMRHQIYKPIKRSSGSLAETGSRAPGRRHIRGFRAALILFAVAGTGALFSQCEMLPLVSTISVRVTGYAAAGVWSPAESIASVSECAWPHVGFLSDGTALAAWTDQKGGGFCAASLPVGDSWKSMSGIPFATGVNSLDFDVWNKTAIAAWIDDTSVVQWAMYNAQAGTWDSGNLGATYPARDLQVAVVSDLAGVIAFEGKSDGKVYRATVGTGLPSETAPIAAGRWPQIAANHDWSKAVIVYQRDDRILDSLIRWGPTDNWTNPSTVSPNGNVLAYDGDSPCFSFDLSFMGSSITGDAAVVWLEDIGGGSLNVSGKTLPKEAADWANGGLLFGTGESQNGNPRVALNSRGNSMAVWYNAGVVDGDLIQDGKGKSFSDIGGSSDMNDLADGLDGRFYYFSVRGDGKVFANTFEKDEWGNGVEIDDNARLYKTGDSFVGAIRPSLAVDSAGHAIAVWAGKDGIYSTRYTPKS